VHKNLPRSTSIDARQALNDYQNNAQTQASWDDFAKSHYYGTIRNALHRYFVGLCAYCEIIVSRGTIGPVEHFRPRSPQSGTQPIHFGADHTFDWMNLKYACSCCQQIKANKWPGIGYDMSNLQLRAKMEGWAYLAPNAVDGYVDPDLESTDATVGFFDFDTGGRISARDTLNDQQRSKAWRTICDLQLNERKCEGKRIDLPNERLQQLAIVTHYLFGFGRRRRAAEKSRYCSPFHHSDTKRKPPVQFPSFIEAADIKGWLGEPSALPLSVKVLYDRLS